MNRYTNTFLMLGVIISVLLVFVNVKPYKPSPIITYIKTKISMIDPRFYYFDIREGQDSYTENKTIIYLCTRDPETGKYYDENTLIYVCLHECAHLLMDEYDENHSEKFNKVLQQLLRRAVILGIYDPRIPISPTYCNIHLKR